jgi:hypothetical protein
MRLHLNHAGPRVSFHPLDPSHDQPVTGRVAGRYMPEAGGAACAIFRGEGLVGLARGFMYARAPRIVTSLWKVDDRGHQQASETILLRVARAGAVAPGRGVT